MANKLSIVEYFYDDDGQKKSKGHRCGYCKSEDTNISQGMWAHQLTCEDYQDLIDRGWRRSGKYLYKPNMKKTCCPLYTIRCDATKFIPSKSHKKSLKKIAKFLTNQEQLSVPDQTHKTENSPAVSSKNFEENMKQEKLEPKPSSESKCIGADPTKPKCQKAKLVRMERKRQKLAAKGIKISEQSKQSSEQESKSFEELIAAHLPNDQSKHRLECVLLKCDQDSPEFQKTYKQSFELFCKYQTDVHKDKPEKLNEKRVKLVKVDMENEDFERTLHNSHRVFAKYQMNIHGDEPDDCGFIQFKRFLVDSPLLFEKHSSTPTTGWGSFHEQFFLDGNLIAVGVLDILPYCISSVYFYYDTDYSFLSLGVYSALRELHLTREIHKSSAQLKYYYMGFYVHSCQKMRYKGQYSPSYLACPETYSWIPIEKCTPKIDIQKYSRLDATDKEDAAVDVNEALILFSRKGLMSYRIYKSKFRSENDEKEVQEYAQLVGPLVAPRMALFRQ